MNPEFVQRYKQAIRERTDEIERSRRRMQRWIVALILLQGIAALALGFWLAF